LPTTECIDAKDDRKLFEMPSQNRVWTVIPAFAILLSRNFFELQVRFPA
jgi:hypothetical protein